MSDDRRWMYDGWRKNAAPSNEWAINTKAFISRAFSLSRNRFVKCPCSKCCNFYCKDKFEMERDLCRFGFMPGYETWYEHGELYHNNAVVDERDGENKDEMEDMVEAPDRDCGADESKENSGSEVEKNQPYDPKASILAAETQLMSIKSKYNLSNKCCDDLMDLLSDIFQ